MHVTHARSQRPRMNDESGGSTGMLRERWRQVMKNDSIDYSESIKPNERSQ